MSERRAHPRVKGPFEGWWDGAATKAGRITDLSVGGCFIESVAFPPAGQTVTVSIAVGGGQLNIPGEVLYGESNQGFAVKFVDMPDGLTNLLAREIENKLAR